MIFEWNDDKARSNLGKHRVSFPQATTIFLDPDHVILDAARAVDGEARQTAVGKLGTALRSGFCHAGRAV